MYGLLGPDGSTRGEKTSAKGGIARRGGGLHRGRAVGGLRRDSWAGGGAC